MTIEFPRRDGNPHRAVMFETWAGRMQNGSGAVTAALQALVGAYKSFQEQYARIDADETCTPGAKIVKAATAARALVPHFERLDAANQQASEQAAQLEAKTKAAYTPKEPPYWDVSRHNEIRAHFKTLSDKDKLALLESAKAEDDEDTLVAVCSHQAYLSNLPPQIQQMYRHYLIGVHAPQEHATLQTIREQQGYAAQFRAEMLQSLANTVDFRKADELIVAARHDLAAA